MDKLQLDGIETSNVTETRIIIERGIVKAAILNGTAEDFQNIENKLALFNATVKDASDNAQVDTFSQRIAFHDALAEATHNNLLILYDKVLRSWVERMPRWFPDLEERKRIYQTYHRIFRAIQEKDATKAQDLIEAYIRRSMKKIVPP
jgi:DNA-binding FadR family transcriptional regulator